MAHMSRQKAKLGTNLNIIKAEGNSQLRRNFNIIKAKGNSTVRTISV